MEQLRIGILGAARIARSKVIPALRTARNCHVAAVATRSDGDLAGLAVEWGVPRVFPSYEALLASDEIDAVYLPLPNHLHALWTVAAARAGKHVLCEKPLAMTATEALRMAAVCDIAGVTLMEGFMYRFHPMWTQILDMVGDGTIGKLRTAECWFTYHNDDPDDIRNIADYGGGALMDIGCYLVSVARLVFGTEPEEVSAVSQFENGVDVLTSGVLGFADGQATFTCGTRSERDQGVRIVGSHGRIEVERPFNADPVAPEVIDVIIGGERRRIDVPAANAYTLQVEAFADAVHHDLPVPIAPEDSIANLAVLDRIAAQSSHSDRCRR